MRKFLKTVAMLASTMMAGVSSPVDASMIGMTRNLGVALERIRFETPTLAPMAYTQFCMRYSADCKPLRMIYRGGPVRMTDQRWVDLADINATVNRDIRPERNTLGISGEEWVINPSRGDCNDYAVSKRHMLLARGWPARSLLLSEVVLPSGEHHLVLVVRTRNGDLVLDNMNQRLQPWYRTAYQWVRMQSPNDPNIWSKIGSRRASNVS